MTNPIEFIAFLVLFGLLFIFAGIKTRKKRGRRGVGKRRRQTKTKRTGWFSSKRTPTKTRANSFYEQPAWKSIRDRRRKQNNEFYNLGKNKKGVLLLKCDRCGIVGTGHQIDHIEPRSTHPHLELSFPNTQTLCSTRSRPLGKKCNQRKSNNRGPNWRRVRAVPGGAVLAFFMRRHQVKTGKRSR